MKKTTLKAIYCEHYGRYWFKLTIPEWEECLRTGIKGESHWLPESAALQERPRHIKVEGTIGSPQASYWSTRDDCQVWSPLDWEPEDYKDALEQLEERLRW
jgi:hypothetical protein